MEPEPIGGIIYTKEYKQWYRNLSDGQRMFLTCMKMDEWRMLIEIEVREENPGISKVDLRIETFKRMYPNDFSPEQIEEITTSMRKSLAKHFSEQKL